MSWKWPWNRQQTPSEPPAPPLEQRVAALETALPALQLQWQETLDKLGRWSGRQAARERARVNRDLDQLGEGPETLEDAPGDTNGGGPGVQVPTTIRAAQKAALRRQITGRFSQ